MFFDLGKPKKECLLRAPPLFVDTGWRPPTEFPNLSCAKVIGFDLERKEDDWDNGPGWRRGKAVTCGFSLSARDASGNRGSWYFPIRHAVEPEYNMDAVNCLGYLRHTLHTPNIPKVGANLLYDIGSLTDDNIFVQGELFDIQFAEALLQSDGDVNLEWLSQKYLGRGKETNTLYDWLALAYGGKANGTQRANIWRASPRLAGPYGEQDASLPIDVFEQQYPRLIAEQQVDLFRMECGLIPLLIRMRLAGVRVDIPAAEKLYAQLAIDIKNKYDEMTVLWGSIESVNSNDEIAKLFDQNGIKYPVTEHGNPSFRKDWLKNLDHPIADLINDIRGMEKVRGTFLRNYILNKNINGQLFCSFHPLLNDENGAKTGRFASSDPNLQNIPVRTELGKAIRRIFVHDLGHIAIEKDDMSQQEYRELAHFAVGPGSNELRAEYNNNPKTDYHDRTYNQICPFMGYDPNDVKLRKEKRRPLKNTNFGLVYGMQQKKLIRQNDMTPRDGEAFFKAYHEANPYVRPTMDAAAAEMQQLGYISTILGRRIRFTLWEPKWRDFRAPKPVPLPFDMALNMYGSQIKRAGEHKAINYRLQGSNADHMKKGMYDCDRAGIWDIIGAPRLTVHDELVNSVINDSPIINEAYREMRHIIENCIPHMRVPCRIDHKRGPNWGACE